MIAYSLLRQAIFSAVNLGLMRRNNLIYVFLYFLGLSCSCEPKGAIGVGVEESFVMEGKDATLPVWVEGNTASKVFILLIHGGPGGNSTVYNQLQAFSEPLEDTYAMVYFDQRCTGLSTGDCEEDSLTVEALVKDLKGVKLVLEARYGRDNSFFLMGHGWGGYLSAAFLLDRKNQRDFEGWINIGGIHDFPLMFATSQQVLVEQAQAQIASGNAIPDWQEILEEVEGADIDLWEDALRINQSSAQAMDLLIALDSVTICEADADIRETLNAPAGVLAMADSKMNSVNLRLLKALYQHSIAEEMENIELPSLFIWGRFDYTVPLAVGYESFSRIGAEERDMLILPHSGHASMCNETAAFMTGVTNFIETYKQE